MNRATQSDFKRNKDDHAFSLQVKSFPLALHQKMKILSIKRKRDVRDEYIVAISQYLLDNKK